MKRLSNFLIIAFAALFLAVGFAACGGNGGSGSGSGNGGGGTGGGDKPSGEHTHTFIETVIEPTCTEKGYTIHKCECGEKYEDSYVSALDHKLGEWKVTTPATEEKEGEETRVCTRDNCEYTETRKIPALSHTHEYTETVVEPTCTENGYTLHKCECGDEYKDNETEALGHLFGEWEVIKQATEKENGIKKRTCVREECSYNDTQLIPVKGHIHTYTERMVAATCTTEGYTLYKCACGEQYKSNYTNALGHKYYLEKTVKQDSGVYRITLFCEKCDNLIYPITDKGTIIPATCKERGYTQYNYSYENIVEGKQQTVKSFIKVNYTETVNFHAIGETIDGKILRLKPFGIADALPIYTYDDNYQRFFDDKIIVWNETPPASCKKYKTAVFTCLDCKEYIVIALYGKHSYVEKSEVSCTKNGYTYKECSVCKEQKDYKDIPATGHKYSFVNGSFNETANTAQFKCVCGNTQVGSAKLISSIPADRCFRRACKTYETVLENGIGATQKITFSIEDSTEALYHTVKAGVRKFEAYNIATGKPFYEQNDMIKQLIKDGTIRWSEGVPSNCSVHMPAVFTCTVCCEKIVIALSGEHTLIRNSNDEPTCTKRGATFNKCSECNKNIEQDEIGAKGHFYSLDTASWKTFLALDNKNGASVVFKCDTCGDTITLIAKETILPENRDICTTIYIKRYDFYTNTATKTKYTYSIETAEGGSKTATFEYEWKDVTILGAHTIGDYNGTMITVVPFIITNPEKYKYEWSDAFSYFFENGTIFWNEGKPGNCECYMLAVFRCKTCGEQIAVQISGEHFFDSQRVDKNSGKTEEHCAYCDRWFERDSSVRKKED